MNPSPVPVVNPASSPLSDPGRLAALRRTLLLDTPAEESFDRLTRIAARLIGAPSTFLSLVDEERDFYKSCFGFGEPLASTRELSGLTFCHYVIDSGEPLVIPDTLADPVYRQVPTVRTLGVRAYVGIPLVTSDGYTIGSFCAIDSHPREWTPTEVEVLTELAASAMREIELRTLVRETEREREEKLALLESTSEGIYGMDERGCCTFLNRAGAELLGYAPERVMGENMHRLIHHTRADGTPYPEEECPIADAYRRGTTVRLEGELLWRSDGTSFVAEYAAAPVFRDGGVVGAVVTFVDITRRTEAEAERQRAEGARRESESRTRTVLESAPMVVWTNGPSGRVAYFNQRWYEYTGRSRAESEGVGWMAALHPDDLPELRRVRERAIVAGEPYGVEFRLEGRDGGFRWHRGRVVPLRGPAGEVEGWIGSAADIHDVRQAEAVQRFLSDAGRALASSLDYETTLRRVAELAVPRLADLCVIDVLEEGGEIRRIASRHADPARAELAREAERHAPSMQAVDHPVVRAIRTGATEVIPEWSGAARDVTATSPEHRELMQKIDPRSGVVAPLTVRGRTLGSIQLVSTDAARVYDADTLALVEELAGRAALAVDNARLYTRAQQAIRQRDEVLGIVSHDLRNPVHTAFMSSSLLLDLLEDGGESIQRKQLGIIKRATERMNRLIGDLLDVTRLESGRLVLYPSSVEVPDLLREVREIFEPLAAERSLELEVRTEDTPASVCIDPERILQVFTNLVGNAAKFTPAGGRIGIRAWRADGAVCFSVADTGPGIPRADLPRIFDRFWQAKQTAREGTGLGLPIARGIVEAHGGSIRVESTVGEGTTFVFTLPLAPPCDPQARDA
ncbi:MAG: PAS domain S-box protein [Gemmatimonadetes bacterium]|nr:PAS domain S-box protein [Gemmatimonadota bacterium]